MKVTTVMAVVLLGLSTVACNHHTKKDKMMKPEMKKEMSHKMDDKMHGKMHDGMKDKMTEEAMMMKKKDAMMAQ